jgi:anthranilate phosphoribosyltransferase
VSNLSSPPPATGAASEAGEVPASEPPAPGSQRRQQRLETLGAERARFRSLIGKVGSGEHTSTGLSRAEAREAMELMLGGRLAEAQIGAFLIAHRIRRPSPEELAGMLEAYRALGPALESPGRKPFCFGVPSDGRSRSAPLLPLIALGLAAMDQPVVLHGGDPMPVKYGVTQAELFAALGIEWRGLALGEVQQRLDRDGLALTHQPDHFASAEALVPVRDLIGKRPPLATLELLWTPHRGQHLLISGHVHPPTEGLAREALGAAGETDLLLIKGQEGSTDLPISQSGLICRVRGAAAERMRLNPRDHGISGQDLPWSDLNGWRRDALAALLGEGPLAPALLWNLAVLLWLGERAVDLPAALAAAHRLLQSGDGEALRRRLAAGPARGA